jgi:hypothetical protein
VSGILEAEAAGVVASGWPADPGESDAGPTPATITAAPTPNTIKAAPIRGSQCHHALVGLFTGSSRVHIQYSKVMIADSMYELPNAKTACGVRSG